MSRIQPLPWATCTFVALSGALALGCADGPLVETLTWHRDQPHSWWTTWTCHLVHWGGMHAWWNLVVALALGSIVESRGRRAWAVTTVTSMTLIPMAVRLLQPELATYRGASGVLAAWCVLWIVRAWRQGTAARWIPAGLGLLMVGKVAREWSLRADGFANDPFVPVAIAHAVGAAVGGVVAWRASSLDNTRNTTRPPPDSLNPVRG